MLHRPQLRANILKAWSSVIKELYDDQRINSERSLQAAIWSALNARLPNVCRMFIEPTLRIDGCENPIIPDIVICGKFRISAVIEMKYRPRGDANFLKDLHTLETIARCSKEDFVVANMRYEGKKSTPRVYRLSPTSLLVWAGVHRPIRVTQTDPPELLCNAFEIPKSRFLQLHAETVKGGKALIRYLPKH